MTSEDLIKRRKSEIIATRLKRAKEDWRDEVDGAIIDAEAGDKNAKKRIFDLVVSKVKHGCHPWRWCLDCEYGGNSQRFINGKTACEIAAEYTKAKRNMVISSDDLADAIADVARIKNEIEQLKKHKLDELEARLIKANSYVDVCKRVSCEHKAAFDAIEKKLH